jgi:hypothetical protein
VVGVASLDDDEDDDDDSTSESLLRFLFFGLSVSSRCFSIINPQPIVSDGNDDDDDRPLIFDFIFDFMT